MTADGRNMHNYREMTDNFICHW